MVDGMGGEGGMGVGGWAEVGTDRGPTSAQDRMP